MDGTAAHQGRKQGTGNGGPSAVKVTTILRIDTCLPVLRLPHPVVPVRPGPLWLQLLPEIPRHHPAEAWEEIRPVEAAGPEQERKRRKRRSRVVVRKCWGVGAAAGREGKRQGEAEGGLRKNGRGGAGVRLRTPQHHGPRWSWRQTGSGRGRSRRRRRRWSCPYP